MYYCNCQYKNALCLTLNNVCLLKVMSSVPSQQEALYSQRMPSESLLDRMLPVLTNDSAAGGPFIYYLKR